MPSRTTTRRWTGQLIAPDDDLDGAPLLRREVVLDGGHGAVATAELHVTALGVVEAFLAGRPVSDELLSPGWSSYEWRLRYRSHDVTSLLAGLGEGARTVLGLALGNGWFRGRLAWSGQRALYGDELAALAELEVTYADGHVQLVTTDGWWRAGPSGVLANDLYDGQTIDARLRDPRWLRPAFGDAGDDGGADVGEPAGWTGVHPLAFDTGRLVPRRGPAVRRQAELRPVRIWSSPSGRTLADFGQNVVGWVRCTVTGPAGTAVTLRHAEVLEGGEIGVRPLRTAQATDRFVLSGGPDVFEPTSTFHGFRYVEVDGWPGEPRPDDLIAVVIQSDLARIGEFTCSDERLDQLHRNVVWSLRGNTVDVPTDCPQRDERLGWTGDLAVFAPTAAYLYDMSAFLDEWLADLAVEQRAAGGRVPFVVPDALKYVPRPDDFLVEHESCAIWSDAAVWVPWALWQAYGDEAALRRHYPAMAAHARYVSGLLSPSGLWDTGFQFGDWLDPAAPPEDPHRARADSGVVATAAFHRTLAQVTEAAELLGETGDAGRFAALRDRVRTAFRQHYVAADGTVTSDCPTVYALAIGCGLLDGDQRAAAGHRLAQLVADGGYTVATGFAGTPFVLDALADTGHLDVAYRMLTTTRCPSWLYPVTMGATTIWERWDSMLPDGSINPGGMTSFNHYALGSVADWLHRTVAGIAPLAPGYRRVLVAPRPGGGITAASAALRTPHGVVRVSWELDGAGEPALDVELPPGVTAVVRLPGHDDATAAAGRHRFGRRSPRG